MYIGADIQCTHLVRITLVCHLWAYTHPTITHVRIVSMPVETYVCRQAFAIFFFFLLSFALPAVQFCLNVLNWIITRIIGIHVNVLQWFPIHTVCNTEIGRKFLVKNQQNKWNTIKRHFFCFIECHPSPLAPSHILGLLLLLLLFPLWTGIVATSLRMENNRETFMHARHYSYMHDPTHKNAHTLPQTRWQIANDMRHIFDSVFLWNFLWIFRLFVYWMCVGGDGGGAVDVVAFVRPNLVWYVWACVAIAIADVVMLWIRLVDGPAWLLVVCYHCATDISFALFGTWKPNYFVCQKCIIWK